MIDAASGTAQYSSTFVPEIWSGKLLIKFYAATTIQAISNTRYEGDIKDVGDKVIIRQVPDINVSAYTKGMNLSHQRPEAANVEFEIDKAYYFDFICDDIDVYQTDIPLMNAFSEDASEQMKIQIDTVVLEDIYNDAATYNAGNTAGYKSQDITLGVTSTPFTVTKTNILELFVDCDTCLDEYNAPSSKRWIIITPWMRGMLLKSDLKDASMTGDGKSVLRNGRIGAIGNFEIYVSNLIYNASSEWFPIAGQENGLFFASQMTKMEHLDKVESTFGKIVRGLNVFGYKVLKDTALVNMCLQKG